MYILSRGKEGERAGDVYTDLENARWFAEQQKQSLVVEGHPDLPAWARFPRKARASFVRHDASSLFLQETFSSRLGSIHRGWCANWEKTYPELYLIAYYGARRSRVRSHPGQQSEMMPVTIPG
jgi:hypothetical protein